MAIFLSLSFLLFICQNTEVEGMVRTYGQNCEDGGPCLGAHVSCLATGVCGCSSADDMIYDHSIRDCVANLGKVCGLDSECIEGALCIEGICKCEYGFYASPEGICVPKKAHKEFCSSDSECGISRKIGVGNSGVAHHRPLICLDGVCQCDRKVSIFSETRGFCVGLVDSQCWGGDCTAHAECRKTPLAAGRMTCQCETGFTKASQGLCGLAFDKNCGQTLTSPNTCSDLHFMCIDGKCTCKYPLHQVYDDKSKECLSLVSGPCTFPRNIQQNFSHIHHFQRCIKNAQCVDKGFYSECECKKRYQATQAGSCAPGFGEQCEPGSCDPDDVSQLYCRNGVCNCLDFLQVYDPLIKKCRGLVGTRCTEKSPFCTEFASCVIPNPNLPGKCLCDKYSREVGNRTCEYRPA
ncbi:prion-like-(Q/N-rich) domain-bearing protein 25 [Folsomia candida]|uniref:EGF-like domain-containing protein n=1 Tax=Folsomia candida TaxID=158441 RepID=A0A226D1G4_FOLCA|nr:prion-like-(Q/N-rich) domain-bearing protein 25 [Folsomia candida]OXA38900.1 hypothetical protein Fcan01_26306 [Folsomia candida]